MCPVYNATDVLVDTTSFQNNSHAYVTQIILPLTLSLLALFVWFGNVMIILAVFTTPRIKEQPNHIFVLSLSVSDGIMGLAMLFMALRYLPSTKKCFDSSKWMCLFCLVLSLVSGLQSLLTLMLMAFDRLLYVQKPFLYLRLSTDRVYRRTAAVSWLAALVYGAFPFYYNVFDPKIGCVAMFVVPFDTVRYTLAIPGTFCICLIGAFYARIVCIARRQRRKIRNEIITMMVKPLSTDISRVSWNIAAISEKTVGDKTIRENEGSDAVVAQDQNQVVLQQQQVHQHQMLEYKSRTHIRHLRQQRENEQQQISTGLFLTVNCIFTLCWLPFLFNCLLAGIYDFADRAAGPVMFVAMTNSGMNFVICALKNDDFARAFRRLLTTCRNR